MAARRRSILVASLLSGALALTACTDDGGTDRGEPAPTEAAHRMPLAVAVHHSRPIGDLTLAQAQAVVDGEVDDWSDLGQDPGPLSVVRSVEQVAEDPATVAAVPADDVVPRVRVPTIDGVDPLTAGEDFALTAPADAPPAVAATLSITGDIMLGRRVGQRLSDDPAAVLRPMAERLASADVTVGNLESTLSRSGAPTQGGDSFGADPAVLEGLRLAGFDVLSLANNHLGDYGAAAIVETVDRLRDAGFRTVGGGADLARAAEPVVVEAHGLRIGFVATDSIGETPAAGPSSPGTNRIDAPPRTGPLDEQALARVAEDVRSLAGRTDVVVALPHWGTQYTNVPEQSQRQISEALVEAGADLVVGGHPHWVQGWETIAGAPVVHSLGNFVFDMDFMVENTEGIVLEVVVRGDQVVSAAPVPYVIGDDFAPRVVDGARAERILERLRETSTPPYDAVAPR